MRKLSRFIAPLGIAALSLVSSRAFAQSPPAIGAAAPPPDAKALVAGPKGPADAPKIEAPKTDETNVNVSAGGLITTGNSKTVALTMNGLFDMRRGNNGLLVGLIGNYGESTIAPATEGKATAQNLQGKLRYDRYFLDNLSGFLIATGRHDRFQVADPRAKPARHVDHAEPHLRVVGRRAEEKRRAPALPRVPVVRDQGARSRAGPRARPRGPEGP